MLELIKTLKDTPLPIVLVIGGLIFLLIPFIQKIQAKEVGVETANQFGAGVIGFILLVTGIGLYVVPATTIVIPTSLPATQTVNVVSQPTLAQIPTQSSNISAQASTPLRDQKNTTVVGTGILEQGTYSDGMASISASEISNHLNIQRIRLEENSDGCGIAFMDADKIWFGSSVKTNLTINDAVVGTINAPTGKHGYIFNTTIHSGDKICVSYFEPSGFQIVFGPDIYYHYDSYCYRGNC